MADGDPLVIGQNNSAQSRTLLERTSPTMPPVPDEAFRVANNAGIGIGVSCVRGGGIAATSLSGDFVAVAGNSFEGTGVVGFSGVNQPVPPVTPLAERRAGVFGTSVDRAGVVGESEANAGVRGDSANGVGVRGESRTLNGVEGRSRAASASGVYGQNDGGGFGVAGRTRGPASAVFGDNTSGGGVQGNSVTGFGVQGNSTSTHGVQGNSVNANGVQGNSQNGVGVLGQSFSTTVPTSAFDVRSAGVLGIGPTVTATSPGLAGTGAPGVLGRPADRNPVGNGVEGRSPRGWAGLFRNDVLVQGDFFVQGAKSAAVPHPDGSTRVLYSVESPESWFEDFGRAELREGRARVEIDPDFAALVKTEDDYHVFLTPEAETAGLFVSERTSSGFEVREQAGGSLPFSYRIVVRRRDVDAERLRTVDVPPPVPAEELLS
jgi:hypothetical protein